LKGLLLVFAAGLVVAGPALGFAGYAPSLSPTVVVAGVGRKPSKVPNAIPHRGHRRTGMAVIPGYLSPWGLPPVQGQFTVSDSALVFHSAEGATTTSTSAVSLAYVDRDRGRSHYLFRIDGGVFETDMPGVLLHLAESGGTSGLKPALEEPGTSPAGPASKTMQEIALSPYADTLYRLFGKPQAALGTVGLRGRRAGRLGEYIASRDSLALDPGRMNGEAQLRHTIAHELAHRWQSRARSEIAMLWTGVPAIRDQKRYGYGNQSEHQAEAIAFAVHYLQTTATGRDDAAASLALLDHYELLVPGTRTMARYLSLQQVYRRHPLRSLLTPHEVRFALEK
jgi:hypothetical protein